VPKLKLSKVGQDVYHLGGFSLASTIKHTKMGYCFSVEY
jgi:hypothetical protein